MKVRSVRQPWGELIVTGIKRVENRSWRTAYRAQEPLEDRRCDAGRRQEVAGQPARGCGDLVSVRRSASVTLAAPW